MCELAMLIFGIISLVTGKFTLSRNRVVYGTPARMVGVILLLPIPITVFCAVIVIAAAAFKGNVNPEKVTSVLIPIELGSVVLCLIAALTVARVYGEPKRSKVWNPRETLGPMPDIGGRGHIDDDLNTNDDDLPPDLKRGIQR